MGRGWGDGKLAGVSGMNEISYISSGDNLRVLTAGADLRINVWDPSHIGGDAEKTLTTEEDDSILVMVRTHAWPLGEVAKFHFAPPCPRLGF
mmetsp:Transcript_29557/g.94823  ORF Transcript_29557/g.94823 Transcript_29557/m.94823 type:complete len:92 (-) Transcript_29557:2561-2836(-)